MTIFITFRQTTTSKVVVGRHNQMDFSSLPGDVYSIERIVYHPKYDDPRNQFDIALLYLNVRSWKSDLSEFLCSAVFAKLSEM